MFDKFNSVFDLMDDFGIELPTGIVLPENTFNLYFREAIEVTTVYGINLDPSDGNATTFAISHNGRIVNFLKDKEERAKV